MAGIFKSIIRANWGKNYGDTIFPGGKLAVTVEKGKCIAWLMGSKDHELSKSNVKKVELVDTDVTVNDYIDGAHQITQVVDIYNIEVARADSKTFRATLRLIPSTKQKVSELITDGEPQRAAPATSDNAKEGAPAKPAVPAKEGAPAKPAAPDYDPEGKPLEWFSSEAGLEAYKMYVTPQNYFLEDTCKEEYERKKDSCKYYSVFLKVYHKGAKLPGMYFEALVNSINVQHLSLVGTSGMLVDCLKTMAKPFTINDDGEPEACPTDLTPEEIVSVEKNPLLYFVSNFNVFEMENDALGTLLDKYYLYSDAMIYLSTHAKDIVWEENQWLFDKSTYLNDFGTVRKEKSFLKKCKELSKFPEFFENALARLDN